jgi:hypothetical protein
MRFRRPNPELLKNGCLRLAMAGLLFVACSVWSETVILHLKNGDSVRGFVVSTNTNQIVLSNSWTKELIVPLAEITRREPVVVTNVPSVTPPSAPAVAATAPPATNAPVAATPPSTNAPVAAKPQTTTTNAPAVAKPTPPPAVAAATTPAPAPKPVKPKVKHWKANAQVGFDLAYGARDRQNYFGLVKLTYERPYESNPKKFFRNIFETRMDYGKTEDVRSANKLDTSNKTDADIGNNKLFVYNLVRIGYDEIRKIDIYYEAGPGLGYHLFTTTNFVMNTELGLTYQAQQREAPSDDTENVYFRLAEDFTWKVSKTVTLTEKLEVFPQVDLSDFRARFESTLSFPLWKALSFNITVLDLYDSKPAQNVDNNELQIRSSLGITF